MFFYCFELNEEIKDLCTINTYFANMDAFQWVSKLALTMLRIEVMKFLTDSIAKPISMTVASGQKGPLKNIWT